MKGTFKACVLVLAIALLPGGCARSLSAVEIKKEMVGATPRESLSVAYSRTYFQERFMGNSIGAQLLFGPLIGDALWHFSANYEDTTAARLESSPFERLLGDFDVTDYVLSELTQKVTSSKYITFTFTKDLDTAKEVRQFVRSDSSKTYVFENKAIKDRFSCATALKMAYGLGARAGNEQLGFVKSYRPFIRLIGIAKDFDTNAVLWRADIIVFGEKRYKGSEAKADRIDRQELVLAFKDLTSQAIRLLLRSVNGEELSEMPVLFDTARADLEF